MATDTSKTIDGVETECTRRTGHYEVRLRHTEPVFCPHELTISHGPFLRNCTVVRIRTSTAFTVEGNAAYDLQVLLTCELLPDDCYCRF